MKKVLIVIDMQNDFISGPLGTAEARAIVPKVKKKIEDYLKNKHTVLFTKDTHSPAYLDTEEGKVLPVPHCIRETTGWMIPEELHPEMASGVIIKGSFGYRGWEEFFLSEERAGLGVFDIDEIEIVGVCTDICVISNAVLIKTILPETKVSVDASCCAGTTPAKHKMALEVMKSCQINVIGEK